MLGPSTRLPEGTKAQRVYLALRDDILSGVYTAGDNLPGEQKLAVSFAVSRVTIRRSLGALCTEGLIEKRAGSGTIVCRQMPEPSTVALDFSTLMPQLAEMGRNTSAQLLEFTYDVVPEHVASAMGLNTDAQVQIAKRIRLTDGMPFSHLTTYVPESIASSYSESDLATTPLFELLERSGVEIRHADQSVTATLASPALAEALDVDVGSALLSIARVVRNSRGEGVEYLSARYRPDLFRLDMNLARVIDGGSRYWEPTIRLGDTPATSDQNGQAKQ